MPLTHEGQEDRGAAHTAGERAAALWHPGPSARLRGVRGHCAPCNLSVLLVTSPSPQVCPFCQSRLEISPFELPPPSPEPPGVETPIDPRTRYRRPAKWTLIAIGTLSIFLLAFAIILKLHNVEYFWYQPWVNAYSISVGVFILSRFFLAAFYAAPPVVGYEPTVSVIIACRNEEDSIEKTIGRIYAEGYPHKKLEVIVVNDGSTDRTLEEMLRAQARHPSLVVVDFGANKGKRRGMAVGALLAHHEALIYVDSDSFLMPGAIYKIVQGLADPTVAAVAGHTDVENAGTSVLTKMQDVRYFVSYRVMKAAEHVFGAVSCCPGCFSAYRRSLVLNVLEPWLNRTFLGTLGTYGDDRSLTNHLLRHYRVLYDDEALATTIVPDRWPKYIKQQARWKRSWVREGSHAATFMWRKHPVAAISWYAMTILPLLAPLIMLHAVLLAPLMHGHAPGFYLGGVMVVTLLWSLFYWERTGRPYWTTAFAYVITYILFFSWQGYYSLATVRRTAWGTR